jgi:phosphate transport system permease protein
VTTTVVVPEAPIVNEGDDGPAEPPGPSSLARRRPREFTRQDLIVAVSCAAAAVATVWLVFYQLTVFSGAAGFVICSIGTFLAFYYVANRQLLGHVAAIDKVVASLVTIGSVAVIVPLGGIILFLIHRGWHLVSWYFLTHDLKGVPETAPASAGGISHAIIGTLEQIGLATLMGAPAGVVTAIYLNEVRGRLAGVIRIVITAMSALPSIVAGLFIYVTLVVGFGYGFRGFAGSLALGVLLLPNITRTTEEVLKVVHGSLREASMALGAPDWRTVWSVVLPTARTGVATAVLLGIARIVGETAPLLVTVFENTANNANPFSGSQEALSVFVYTYQGLSRAADIERAFAAALVLVTLVIILFVIARLVASIKPGTIGRVLHRVPKEATA